MKRHYPLYVAALLAGFSASLLPFSFAQTVPPAGGRGRQNLLDPNAELVNLALIAKASTSYVSGDQTLDALNDGVVLGRNVAHYGNWPSGGTQWVEYAWPKAISTNRIDVIWYTDGRGIHVPKAYRVQYFDGQKFVNVSNAQGLGLDSNAYNTTTFDEISTPRLRLEIDAEGPPQISTGITEFRVFDSGKSPIFPPLVSAGMERTVVLGGKTFLNPTVKTLQNVRRAQAPTLVWTKLSGPGDVSFANAAAPETSAQFSATGDYTLQLAASLADMSNKDTVRVHVQNAAPAEHADSVFTRHYSIDSPLWNSRVKALIVNWIPHCVDYLENPDKHPSSGPNSPSSPNNGGGGPARGNGPPATLGPGGLDNFIEAGKKLRGEPAARHLGYPFSNAYVHNTVESMCVALTVDPKGDPDIIKAQSDIRATLDKWIPIILAAQEPDGYLQTRFTLNGGNHWDPRTRGEHEGYTAGYFIESAIAHYVATDGKDLRMYNAAKKLADCWYTNVGPGSANKWFDGHQEIEQALVRFGRLVNQVEGAGKGAKYVALAKTLLDNRTGGTSYDQSHLPVVQQYEALGHAVRAAYTYSGMAAVSEESGDLDYQSAVQSLWDNITNKKLYITGGIGSGETSEGFGPNYSLRNNAYCESCSNCGELFFQYSLNLQYQDAKYADLYEQTIYNAILGDIDLDGKNFCYTNALDVTDRPNNPARYLWHSCPCCVGNISRTLLQLPTWMYAKSSDSLFVNMFVGSTATVDDFQGTDVEMVQKTDYPWSGNIAITVNPKVSKTFALKVRIPDRDVSTLYTSSPAVMPARALTSLAVNGQPVTAKIENGYAIINRQWKAGDTVNLVVPMLPQRVKAIDKVAADQGKVALRYGPIVYNFESADNANLDAVLPASAPVSAEFRPNLLDGVMVLKSTFADGSPAIAIPNYARLNRHGRSIVWIQDK